jgi:hypothetical protein
MEFSFVLRNAIKASTKEKNASNNPIIEIKPRF